MSLHLHRSGEWSWKAGAGFTLRQIKILKIWIDHVTNSCFQWSTCIRNFCKAIGSVQKCLRMSTMTLKYEHDSNFLLTHKAVNRRKYSFSMKKKTFPQGISITAALEEKNWLHLVIHNTTSEWGKIHDISSCALVNCRYKRLSLWHGYKMFPSINKTVHYLLRYDWRLNLQLRWWLLCYYCNMFCRRTHSLIAWWAEDRRNQLMLVERVRPSSSCILTGHRSTIVKLILDNFK